jgi:single-stranded-DNA-specific exonuclease
VPPPWRVRAIDEAAASRIAVEARLRRLTARVLVGRGLDSPDLVERFLSPRLADLRPPEGMADLEPALARLQAALAAGERIGVFGDYDVDGVTTAAVLTCALRALGGQVVPRVASRSSGYGFSPADAGALLEAGCRLVVTGDCGTSDHQAIAACAERDVPVLVIDHHQVPDGEQRALALINPHRREDRFPFKGLASCGVAFYIAASLRSRLRAAGHPAAGAFDPRSLLDLVALGTLADLVPLVDENRILVSAGLRELSAFRRPGLRALARVAEIPPEGLTSGHVSFRLTPRLNAAGRLGEAQLALDLLLAPDDETAARLATRLDEVNRERQRIQEDVWLSAVAEAAAQGDAAALVVGNEGWHHGVVGIVAAKLVERYRRPAVVIGFKEGEGRGSARTVGGFNLYEALASCRQHLAVFGGHAQAAGMSVSWEKFPAFRAAFIAVAEGHFTGAADAPAVEVDAVAQLGELDLAGTEELERLRPFGAANAEPLLALPEVVARGSRVVGTGHLMLTLSQMPSMVEAIAFGMADRDPGEGSVVHVIGTAEVDSFKGYRRTRVRVRHLLRATP